jgi:hypothetical protein
MRSTIQEQQSLIDLLALASFYQTAIVPIHSSANFVSVLRKAGASHLRVGGDKLGWRYMPIERWQLALDFTQPLSKLRVPENLLKYATLKRFIESSREFFRKRE